MASLGVSDDLTISILARDPALKEFYRRQNANEMLVISGQITYQTIFQSEHLTQFVFYVDGMDRRKFRRPPVKLVTFSPLDPAELPKSIRVRPVEPDQDDDA